MSNAIEVGRKIVALSQAGKGMEAVETLYSDDIVSIEAFAMGGESRETRGKAAVLAKGKWWYENHEVHSLTVEGPWPHDDQFIATFDIDITPKAGPMKGQRFRMKEAGLYTVKDGKVAKEQFFYVAGA